MSDPQEKSLREELEVRVIGLLTGELSEADTDELEKVMTVDSELADFRDRMAALMADIHAARDEIVPPENVQRMKLSAERRSQILQQFEQEKSHIAESDKAPWYRTWLPYAAVLAVGSVLMALVFPMLSKVRSVDPVQAELVQQRISDQAVAEFDTAADTLLPAPPSPAASPGVAAKSRLDAVREYDLDEERVADSQDSDQFGPMAQSHYGDKFLSLRESVRPQQAARQVSQQNAYRSRDVGAGAGADPSVQISGATAARAANIENGAFHDLVAAKETLPVLAKPEPASAPHFAEITQEVVDDDGFFELDKNARSNDSYNNEQLTSKVPVSTFSLNVSDVSFKLARAALERNQLPSPEVIRAEEFVNSFAYPDLMPRGDEPVALHWDIARHPFEHNRQIVRFSLQTQATGRNPAQPLNLTLLVDNSGSMQRPDRRSILTKGLAALQQKLTSADQLNIVLFARNPKLIARATSPVEHQIAIEQALNFQPEGGTNLAAGLQAAYEVARQHFDPTANNRVILLSDGAANLGDVDSSGLAKTVIANRKQGIALDAYGIGWEDYNDALLEEITRNGDGRYAFLNDVDSAAGEFAEKLAGAFQVEAADVKVQINWNEDRVHSYRQIGYESHQLQEQDFHDNTVDAAEMGAAEAGTALYVVKLNEDPGVLGGLGTLKVRYRVPATGHYEEHNWPLEMPRSIPAFDTASFSLRLAAVSAFFAEHLANLPSANHYSVLAIERLARDLPTAFPNQARVSELMSMIQTAESLLGVVE